MTNTPQSLLSELQARMSELLRNSPAADIERNMKALLGQTFQRFDLVTRDEFEAQLEGRPLRKLKAGDTFYEPTMALHSVSRNPSKTENTRLLAVILHPRDAKELVIQENPKH